MKKIAALVCLSAGLFCLFPDDAQAQRARWSGFGRNSSYEFKIDLTVQDTDLVDFERGVYLQAIKDFSLTRNPDPGVAQTNISSSGFGKLTISKDKDEINNLEIINIDINFEMESPIERAFLSINYDPLFSDFGNFANVNVNNLLGFFNDLTLINNPEKSFFTVNKTASEVQFRDPNGFQIVTLESAESFIKVEVPEPNLISAFMILFSTSVTGMLKKIKFQNH
ncbi:hypothetical protein [Nostoc sp. TCL26-01]|uniref:hypothetical protein n=1 Tax=Nostoc sp. TCL26-01 TaxID=2576904 RepID=UPI0015B83664|nr:hypothetical protein [Nostoc sp. TCL26-01]QLE54313.1 hypothetical protein FD725_01455 [Nostoc sp. TCL26-01]